VSGRTPRVACYGFFGIGNLGNEASLRAFVRSLERRHPRVALGCIALDPHRVRQEHGIASVPLASTLLGPAPTGRLAPVRKAVNRLADVPRTLRLVGGVDAVVMPGTGSLESSLPAGAFGLPYWLFVAALACRLRGRPFALVSVGADPPRSRVARAFYTGAVRLSDYCSVRDRGSLRTLRSLGVGRPVPVRPDLAFALPVPDGRPEQPELVVLGVMDYPGRPGSAESGGSARRRTTAALTDAAVALLDRGRSVCLVVGDEADRPVAVQVHARARQVRPGLAPDRIRVSPAADQRAVLEEMVSAGVVVGARFHTVVAGLMLAKPVVSLGYAEKHLDLLRDFGLDAYAQRLDRLDAELLARQVDEVQQAHPDRERGMKETLRRYADSLAEQDLRLDAVVLRRRARGLWPWARRVSS
jgi:polysaccharide pyruvyl transferase WcaK-like protein